MFDRPRYDRALKQWEEALDDDACDLADIAAAGCEMARAQGRAPSLVEVATVFGLPPPDRAAIERYSDDVITGRFSPGTPLAQIRDQYYLAEAAERRSDTRSAVERSTLDWATSPSGPGATASRNGDAPAWFIDDETPAPARSSNETERPWSDTTITVTRSVLARVEREIREARWTLDFATNVNFETGGWLYAHDAPDADGVLVIEATGPGPSAEHGEGRLRLSHPRELEDEPVGGTVLVGDWHTHPAVWAGDPTDQASPADEEAWGNRLLTVARTFASGSPWVGLIFMPGTMGWTTPIYRGFLTHRDEHGVVICEQAVVVEAGPS